MTWEQPGGSCERPRRRQLMLPDAWTQNESEPRKREHPRSDRREVATRRDAMSAGTLGAINASMDVDHTSG